MDTSLADEIRDRLDLSALGKPALIGLAALFALVVAFGCAYAMNATTEEFHIEKDDAARESAAVSTTSQRADQASSSTSTAPDSSEQPTIFVHVAGAVRKPGLIELESGSRVGDAVTKAGGFTEDAAPSSVNLARVLTDGEQVLVATQTGEGDSATAQAATGEAAGGNQTATPSQPGLVNLNTASQAELETLPGIGPSTSAKIVADRNANGPFQSVDDLSRVSGIGEKKLESLRELVCV